MVKRVGKRACAAPSPRALAALILIAMLATLALWAAGCGVDGGGGGGDGASQGGGGAGGAGEGGDGAGGDGGLGEGAGGEGGDGGAAEGGGAAGDGEGVGEGDGGGLGDGGGAAAPDDPDATEPAAPLSQEVQAQLAAFAADSQELPMDDVASATELLRAYKALAFPNAPNDELFLAYEEAMQSNMEGLNSNYEGMAPPASDVIMNAMENGFLYISEDEYPHFILRPDFFYDTFAATVSAPIQSLLEIRKKHYDFAGQHDFIENNTLMVTLDQLAEMIADWEGYAKAYPAQAEREGIEATLDYYLKIYIGAIQIENSGLYVYVGEDENGEPILKLADEPQQSYQKFVENYPDSRYRGVVEGLLDTYRAHGFLYTDDVELFFVDNGLAEPR